MTGRSRSASSVSSFVSLDSVRGRARRQLLSAPPAHALARAHTRRAVPHARCVRPAHRHRLLDRARGREQDRHLRRDRCRARAPALVVPARSVDHGVGRHQRDTLAASAGPRRSGAPSVFACTQRSHGQAAPRELHSGRSTGVRAEHCRRARRGPMVEPSEGTDPAAPPDARGAVKLPLWRRILVERAGGAGLRARARLRARRVGAQHGPPHRPVRRHDGAARERPRGAGRHFHARHQHTDRGDQPRRPGSPTGTADEGEEAGAGHPRWGGADRARRDPQDRAVRPVRDALEGAQPTGAQARGRRAAGQRHRHHRHEERRHHRDASGRSSTR